MNRALKMVPGLLEHGPGEGSLVVSLDGIFAQKGCRTLPNGSERSRWWYLRELDQYRARLGDELQPKLRT